MGLAGRAEKMSPVDRQIGQMLSDLFCIIGWLDK